MDNIPIMVVKHLSNLVVGIPIAIFAAIFYPPRPSDEEQQRSKLKGLTSSLSQKQRDNSSLSSKLQQSNLESSRKDQLIHDLKQQLDTCIKSKRSLELQLWEAQARLKRMR
jgi:hypothetical protein